MWNDALPKNGITNWSVFTQANSSTTTNGWQSWMRPAGCSWIYFFVISGGSAGSGGNGATPTSGAGGGSGSVTRLLIPATVLPDIIYLRPARGGLFGDSTAVTTYISIAPNTTAQNLILSAVNATRGFLTTGGAGAAAATSASGIWMNVGLFTSIAGQTGAAGISTADTVGNSVTFGASGLPITAGASGGTGSGAGGNITGAGLMPTISGGAGTTGGNGGQGFRLGQTFAPGFKLFPLLFSGGAGGGGSNNTVVAGAGGNGSYGCGGGGGGSTNVIATPNGNGPSGNGGDALILIGAF